MSYIKIKHHIIFKKGVASDCRTHMRFPLTIFLYLYKIFVYYIYIYILYIYIIYTDIYINIYTISCIYKYMYYILYIYIYMYIYLSIKHTQCIFLSIKVFVCVASVCLFMYIHLSGYVSFVFNLN